VDENHEFCATLPSDPGSEEPRWRFSLATLLRGMTLTAFALGWIASVPSVPPLALQLGLLILGALLAIIVGWRRSGSLRVRVKAASWFLAGTVAIALYSGYVANTIPNPIQPWATLDQLFSCWRCSCCVHGRGLQMTG